MIVEPPWTILPAVDVRVERAHDALVVERAVLPEAAVLDRDRRLRRYGEIWSSRSGCRLTLDGTTPSSDAVVAYTNEFCAERDRLERVQAAGAEEDRAAGPPRRDEQRREHDDGRWLPQRRPPARLLHPAQPRAAREQERRELEVGTIPVPAAHSRRVLLA